MGRPVHGPLRALEEINALLGCQRNNRLFPIRFLALRSPHATGLTPYILGFDLQNLGLEQGLHGSPYFNLVRMAVHFQAYLVVHLLQEVCLLRDDGLLDHSVQVHQGINASSILGIAD